ncbi:MAG: cytochrome c [Vicinamibacterales bacterium]
MGAVAVLVALLVLDVSLDAQSVDRSGLNGQQLYQAACAACHGNDGRGQNIAIRGFEVEPPDFTDCSLTTPEADLDWLSVVHQGGPARGFDRLMPAFGDELTVAQIGLVIGHVRTFCAERGWPRGDLNLPRPFVTEKAFPENEAVLTTTFLPSHERSLGNQFLYEHRVGRRGQYELFVPFDLHESTAGSWRAGVGDIGAAYKHVLYDSLSRGSIFSAGGEVVLPTGSESKGLGNGVAMFEAFGTFSQMLPRDGFLHAHTGIEVPADPERAAKETFWRLAVGKSFMQERWGRSWSPMVEIIGARELEDGSAAEWDVLPQVQVSLSRRQHILLNIGARTPVSQRSERRTSVLVYLLWDWFDGGFLSGW